MNPRIHCAPQNFYTGDGTGYSLCRSGFACAAWSWLGLSRLCLRYRRVGASCSVCGCIFVDPLFSVGCKKSAICSGDGNISHFMFLLWGNAGAVRAHMVSLREMCFCLSLIPDPAYPRRRSPRGHSRRFRGRGSRCRRILASGQGNRGSFAAPRRGNSDPD